MKTAVIADHVFLPRTFEEEIHRRFQRLSTVSSRRREFQRGVSLARMDRHRRELSRDIARTIRQGAYRLEPAEESHIRIDGRERIVFRSTLIDTIVTGALTRVLTGYVQPCLSSAVFSYQKGRSSLSLLEQLSAFLRQHRQDRPNIRSRGMYVLQRDVSAYGESIPNVPDSRLWSLLETGFNEKGGIPAAHPFRDLLNAMVRREVRDPDGRIRILEKGVPTGSPIQPLLCNLYLTDLDSVLSSVQGAFYARYGDDFIFCHPDFKTARDAEREIERILAALSLTIAPEKIRNLYFSGPGRPSDEWPGIVHRSSVEHLGCRVAFSGEISLKRDKSRALFEDIRRRVRHTASALRHESMEDVARAVCRVVNRALDPADPLQTRSAALLRHAVNNRTELSLLDHRIALTVAGGISGDRSVRAFRRISYRKLRRAYGLCSLVMARNRGRKGDGSGHG